MARWTRRSGPKKSKSEVLGANPHASSSSCGANLVCSNGQFEETTNTDENAFIQDGELVIKPTLQDEDLLTHNNVLNLTKLGTCTSTLFSDCNAVTNTTNGTIINPVKSARINTKKGASIQYGTY